ncbi:hypothetical protein [Brevibacillus dissolubilis]|uniref:hypothetical protein n=1 Tax=Brevibacillus dissolubilis TaxID=1844116 RepID=UPI001116110C|nr:hypothetical protein [Brevibacillus dissolubilis]
MNAYQANQIEQLQQTLTQWEGSQVLIEKDEVNDRDRVTINLQQSIIHDRARSIDDYVSSLSIQLQGTGTITTDNASTAPLPYDRYEIAVNQVKSTTIGANEIHLETDRGHYTLTRS